MAKHIFSKRNEKLSELTFYTELTISNIQYEEFKEISRNRINMLKQIEKGNKNLKIIKDIKNDIISHMTLKLICSTKEYLSNWFINCEVKLLKLKCERNKEEIKDFFLQKIWPFLNINENIDYESNFDLNNCNKKKFDWNIKIHYSKCSEVLSKRNYSLKKGYFQMEESLLIPFILNEYKNYLNKKMNELKNKMYSELDEKLIEFEKELFEKEEYEIIETKNINENKLFFPLCIRGLLNKFEEKTHLKYLDRQILCRFLKDIGVPLEETIELFYTNFKITEILFKKKYLYGIRYIYGLEGKKINYKSYNCCNIIRMSNNPDIFGCPFVNNHNYVRKNYDIEEIGNDYFKCCIESGSKKSESYFNDLKKSPTEYFWLMKKLFNFKIN